METGRVAAANFATFVAKGETNFSASPGSAPPGI
jgi:hypothetical protein